MSRKEELKEIINKARTELNEIEKEETRQKVSQFKPKWLKYLNSYGGDGEDTWFLYFYIKNQKENGEYLVLSFQQDKDGKIELKKEVDYSLWMLESSVVEEITKEEYDKALENLLNEVSDFSLSAQEVVR